MHIEDLEIGPAKWTHDTAVIAQQSPATVELDLSDFAVGGELSGIVTRRRITLGARATFVPDNQCTTGILGKIYPHLTRAPGASIFAATAKPLNATSIDGKGYIIPDAAVLTMPDLNFAVNRDLFGPVTFVARTPVGANPGSANSLFYKETPDPTWAAPTFAAADYVTGTPLLTWGSVMTSVESDDGWTASFNANTNEVRVDGRLRDVRYVGMEVLVRGIPADSAIGDVITNWALDTDVVNAGENAYALAQQLTVVMGTLTLTIPKAVPVGAGFRWGTNSIRVGEVGFVSVQNIGASPLIATIVKA